MTGPRVGGNKRDVNRARRVLSDGEMTEPGGCVFEGRVLGIFAEGSKFTSNFYEALAQQLEQRQRL
jgi:hypothetical protein